MYSVCPYDTIQKSFGTLGYGVSVEFISDIISNLEINPKLENVFEIIGKPTSRENIIKNAASYFSRNYKRFDHTSTWFKISVLHIHEMYYRLTGKSLQKDSRIKTTNFSARIIRHITKFYLNATCQFALVEGTDYSRFDYFIAAQIGSFLKFGQELNFRDLNNLLLSVSMHPFARQNYFAMLKNNLCPAINYPKFYSMLMKMVNRKRAREMVNIYDRQLIYFRDHILPLYQGKLPMLNKSSPEKLKAYIQLLAYLIYRERSLSGKSYLSFLLITEAVRVFNFLVGALR